LSFGPWSGQLIADPNATAAERNERSEEWLATVASGVDGGTSGGLGPTGESWTALYATYAQLLENDHRHAPAGKGDEMSLGKTIIFWASVVFSVVVVIAGIALAIYACTCGRSYVFAKDCLERLKKESDDKTPEDLKQYVATREFRARCERLFDEVDVEGKGIVEWEKGLNQVPFDEWTDDLRWDELYKELNDVFFNSETVSREEWCDVCPWFEYIKYDIATNGLKPGQGLGEAAKKPDEAKKDDVAAAEPDEAKKDDVAAAEPDAAKTDDVAAAEPDAAKTDDVATAKPEAPKTEEP